MKNLLIIFISVCIAVMFFSCKNNSKKENEMEKQFNEFLIKHEAVVKPLYKKLTEAYFTASITGEEADYNKAAEYEFEYTKIFTNIDDFEFLKKLKESGEIKSEVFARTLDVLYNSYLSNQADPAKLEEMIKLANEIDRKFSTFRANINGKELSDNDIEEILKTSTSSKEVKEAWIAVKELGPVVADDIKTLVKKRNELAKSLGFNNYHEMSLKLSDQDPEEITRIFDELDSLTRDNYALLKNEIDEYLAKKFNIKKEELRPWHYQNRFYQEAPKMYEVDLDKYYKDKNIEKLTIDYYSSIGLDITDIIAKSDLYEKPKKNQHAYCIDIDKAGDIRVLCNIKPNYYWMNTMLHEFGHAVYDKYIDRGLPFALIDPAHTFTTEAIAMLFGRLGSNAQWMQGMLGIDEVEKKKIAEEGFKTLRLEQLVFSRWAQVMYRFEKSMYENPDQDLNKLWWDLVEKYQLVTRPEGRDMPDWATKSHIATSPCYYHNYLLGELLASQLNYYITKNICKNDDYNMQSFYNNKEVGKFLIEKVFNPGAKYHWNTMIEKATGEKLTAKYYAMQFVK
ncbi:MAG TPA: M3 family metallopeptidase [Bacteroidales bacterium]|nr:M3 family metallopeptidase [Bacteroidales bacterium]HOL98302.1 M3 family metallopeptidase [Bacteroidales bacterium]HOM36642.1 M3 family metallopeptidase [Bacteroidales bacterium]HPD24065.1 M3 family metallopeptidase [Bacteroidales bacterium]HRT00070.1 M3 family metallopeptidase [Bacteroidales bacterium]